MKKLFKGLSRDTFLLTFVSLFSDIATEMLYPILPIFLTQTLLAPASVVGIIEGIAIATQNIVQGFSGYIADRLRKRKLLAFLGYTLAACSKPLVGFSTIWQQVLGARFVDRFATGVRSAPRDALIAASAQEEYKGKAFGLEGIGDNLGAFIGPLLAAALLFALHVPIRTIFLLAFIPGMLSAILIVWVREHKKSSSSDPALAGKQKSLHDKSCRLTSPGTVWNLALFAQKINNFPKSYWKYLFVTAIFGIGNSSNAFLILRAKQIGIPLIATILIYACFNLVAALSSFPAGSLSDKIGRKTVLFGAFGIFLITYIGFALTTNYYLLATLFILYGIFSGVYRAVGKATAVDFVPQHFRASAVGWYATTIGLTGLIASVVGGYLWTIINPQATFWYGSIFATLGIVGLLLLVSKST